MKNIITVLSILTLIISCENKKIEELNNKIYELDRLNKKLTDSLNRSVYERITYSELYGISEENDLIANKPNKFKFVFSSVKKLPKYNIYAITKKGGKKTTTLIYEDYTESQFEYDFIPENKTDNSFEIKALFPLDSVVVEIPGKIEIPIK
ncbi:hypothetical protein [Tenacibaculum ovolyticum]|uniref:hypothetical protein n=1 Tax=Tenacibaculum ovolyticum TaxID=104270 RepID=UPI0007EDF5FB|nr:hypothetical protein [Tenacibaculum ovolyticum]